MPAIDRLFLFLFVSCAAASSIACGSDDPRRSTPGTSAATELGILVGSDAATFVRLADAREVRVEGDPRESGDWDLAFRGWDIFTNGGVSGNGSGSAFGPLPFIVFQFGEEPSDIPFLIEDETGGAFRDWYAYDSSTHALYSRFHRFGVKSGDKLFKVQLGGYYGEAAGAPVGGLYQLRYAEVTPHESGPNVDVADLDATAGGPSGAPDAPGTCLDLASGDQQKLTASAARESTTWDLCFRRDAISVNGELGGPRGVRAVDLDGGSTGDETLLDVKARTAASELAAFEAVDYAALTAPGLDYRGDRVISAFSEGWADTTHEPAVPRDSSWLVVAADGESRFLVEFASLEGSTSDYAGSVALRVLRVR